MTKQEAPAAGGNDEAARLLDTLGRGRVVERVAGEGRAVLEFRPREDQCHSGGTVQGGFVTGWVDSAMAHAGLAASNFELSPATLEVKVSFFRIAVAGRTYRAEGWVERAGRSVVFLAGRLTDEEGEVVATGTSTARWVPLATAKKRSRSVRRAEPKAP